MVQSPLQSSPKQDPTPESSPPPLAGLGVDSEPDLELEELDWDTLGEEWLSDEPELESDNHRDQIDLLVRLLKAYWHNRSNVYCSGNTTVYYDESQRTNRNFRGPDIYVVLGADPRPRNSWMIWREGGKYPNVVIELLSKLTAKVDRTTKKDLYQNVWRLPNYFWFHLRTKEFKGFRLVGRQYEAIEPNEAGHLWSDEMELFLGLHEGWLRLFTATGELVLAPEEAEAANRQQAEAQAAQAQQQIEQERLAKEQAQRRADRLADRLRQLGLDPDELA